MSQHTVHSFDNELKKLSAMISQMGGAAEAQMASALTMLQSPDPELADKIVQEDKKIDIQEMEINDYAVQLIARRQPLAKDLREITAAFKIASDLERIGDLAKHITHLIAEIQINLPRPVSAGIRHMGHLALKQMGDTLDAFSQLDKDKALAVWKADRNLDELYNSMIREAITYILEEPKLTSYYVDLLFAAKYIERIGDHTTNIAEHIIYILTGTMPTDRPKGNK